MEQVYRESKHIIDGKEQKIVCHLQNENGEFSVPAHYHTYIELLYCLRGDINIWINNTHYDFCTGDLVVINSNEVHVIEPNENRGGLYIIVRFDPEVLYVSTKDAFDIKYILPFILNSTTPQKVFKYKEIYNTEIPRLMHDAYDEYIRGEYGFELAIRSDICRIFVWILRYWNSMGIKMSGSDATTLEHIKIMQQVLGYMSEHYSENITASDMAKIANMSYSYFSKVFSKVTGRSFNDYLNFIRIAEAEKLLVSTDMNITEIAYETGFSSSSYFIKIFDKYKHASPMHFRKKFLREE